MGLSWQQGPLGRNPNGRFLVPGMPQRVLYAEALRRRMLPELELEPRQNVTSRGIDRNLNIGEAGALMPATGGAS